VNFEIILPSVMRIIRSSHYNNAPGREFDPVS
jgi:hypothetical protein